MTQQHRYNYIYSIIVLSIAAQLHTQHADIKHPLTQSRTATTIEEKKTSVTHQEEVKEDPSISDAELDSANTANAPISHQTELPPTLLQKIHTAYDRAESKLAAAKIFSLEFPVLGTGTFTLAMNEQEKKLKLNIEFAGSEGDKGVTFSPTILDAMQMQMIQDKLTVNGTVNILGKECIVGVKKIVLGESATFVKKLVLQIRFIEPFQATLPNGWPLLIMGGYLTLQSGDNPPVLSTRIAVAGQKVRCALTLARTKVTAQVSIKNIPLPSLIPQVQSITPLASLTVQSAQLGADIWVQGSTPEPKGFHIPELDNTRSITFAAQLEKIPLEIPLEEDVTTQTITHELATDMGDALQTSATAPDTTQSDITTIPPGLTTMIDPKQITISENMVIEALPEIEPTEPIVTLTEAVQGKQETLAPEEVDTCYRETTDLPKPTIQLHGLLNKNTLELSIAAGDMIIRPVGLMRNAQIKLALQRIYQERKDLESRTHLDKKTTRTTEGSLVISAECVPIKQIGMLHAAELTIALKSIQKEKQDIEELYTIAKGRMVLTGQVRVTIPSVGNVLATASITLSRNGLFFDGLIDKQVHIGPITLHNARLVYGYPPRTKSEKQSAQKKNEKRTKTTSLIGTFTIANLPSVGTATVQPSITDPRKKELMLGAKVMIKEVKPLQGSGIPKLEDTPLTNVIVDVKTTNFRGKPKVSLTLSGSAMLLGMLLNATIAFTTNDQGQSGILLYTTPNSQLQTVAAILPILGNIAALKKTFVKNSYFIASTINNVNLADLSDEQQATLPTAVNKGLTIAGQVEPTGTLEPVKRWLNLKDDHLLHMLGSIDLTTPALSELRIGLTEDEDTLTLQSQPGVEQEERKAGATGFTHSEAHGFASTKKQSVAPKSPSTKMTPISTTPKAIVVTFAEAFIKGEQVGAAIVPAFGVAAGIDLQVPHSEPLHCKGAVEFSPIDVKLLTQALGTWNQPFGLQGWSFSDVAFLIGFAYGSGFIPTSLGGTAQLAFRNDLRIAFKIFADVAVANLALEGSINRIPTILDIYNLFVKSSGVSLPDSGTLHAPLEFRNVGIRYAPVQTKIGDQVIPAGFSIKAAINILGAEAEIDSFVDHTGFKAYGILHPIAFKDLLFITSSDAKSGPKVDIQLTLDRQACFITGKIDLAHLVSAQAFMKLSGPPDPFFQFDFIGSIGAEKFEGKPLLQTQVTGKSHGSILDPAFTLTLDFQQTTLRYLRQQANKKLQEAEKELINSMNNAQQEINKIENTIATGDTKITEAKTAVKRAEESLQAIQTAKQKAIDALNASRVRVNTLEQEIANLDTQ